MGDDPGGRAVATIRERDVECVALAAADDPEQLPGGPMAENGARPAGQDRGKPASLLTDPRVADRVDAAVERMEVAAA